jgi:hypothetical protein
VSVDDYGAPTDAEVEAAVQAFLRTKTEAHLEEVLRELRTLTPGEPSDRVIARIESELAKRRGRVM